MRPSPSSAAFLFVFLIQIAGCESLPSDAIRLGSLGREGERAFEAGSRSTSSGRIQEAIRHYERAIRIGGTVTQANSHNNLAWIYITKEDHRDPDKAVEHASIASRIAATEERFPPDEEANILDTLARAYALAGDEEAAEEARRRAAHLTR